MKAIDLMGRIKNIYNKVDSVCHYCGHKDCIKYIGFTFKESKPFAVILISCICKKQRALSIDISDFICADDEFECILNDFETIVEQISIDKEYIFK